MDQHSRSNATPADPHASEACPSPAGTCRPAEDDVCSDEIAHGRQTEDPAMLDGSILDAGAAIAGLMPVESPELERRSRPVDANDCTECGRRR